MREKLKLLIVEDDSVIGLYIQKIAVSSGCEVVGIASDANSAYAYAKAEKIDLLVTDIKIKGEDDGIDAARILQKQYGMPVIFVTAFHDSQTLKRAADVESIGYLVKPIRKTEFEVLLQLCQNRNGSADTKVLKNGYRYNSVKQLLFYQDKEVDLSEKEHALLSILVRAGGNVVSYSDIDEVLWYDRPVSDTARRQLLHRLKGKLLGLEIEVVKKVGYRLER